MNSDRFRRMRISLLVLVLFAVVLTGYLAWTRETERQSTLHAAQQQNLAYARALAEHADRAFSESDRVLDRIRSHIIRRGGMGVARSRELYDYLREELQGLPQA